MQAVCRLPAKHRQSGRAFRVMVAEAVHALHPKFRDVITHNTAHAEVKSSIALLCL